MCISNNAMPYVIGGVIAAVAIVASYGTATPAVIGAEAGVEGGAAAAGGGAVAAGGATATGYGVAAGGTIPTGAVGGTIPAAGGVSTASYVAGGAALAGAGLSAYGAKQQGDAAKMAADYNADAMKRSAQSIEAQGAQVASDRLLKARRLEAAQVTGAGAGGVNPFAGSPLAIESETAEFGELDSLRIINNAQRSAWGLQTQANITGWEGEQARTAGNINAGSTLLGGASRAYYGYAMSGN